MNREIIKDYLEQIKLLEAECYEKRKHCDCIADKIAIMDDYDKDINVYKEEILKLTGDGIDRF